MPLRVCFCVTDGKMQSGADTLAFPSDLLCQFA